ncbi:MAG TPA: hypothetical protein ENF73_05785 [Proteobacteria bacterium]|nr:hypothetical protein [Pseudomonadota bacterium]
MGRSGKRFGRELRIFLVLCALAFCARFFVAWDQSLWTDEVAGVLVSDRGLAGIIGIIAFFDVSPPLSYLFMRLVLFFGRSDIWLRVPFELLGALSCGLLYVLLRRLGVGFAWLAGALLAILPMHLYLSQEVRHYALSSVLSMLWMLTLIDFEDDPRRARGPFILVRLLGIFNHYYLFSLFCVDWAYLVWRRRRDVLKRLLWYQALVGIYYLPWVFALIHQIGARTYRFRVGASPVLVIKDLFSHILFFAADSPEPSLVALARADAYSSPLLLAAPFLFVLLAGAVFPSEFDRARKLLLSWLLVPVLLVALVAWRVPLYQHRYFIIVLGAFCGLLALGFGNLARLNRWVAISFGAIVVFVWSNVLLEYHLDETYHREDWRALSSYLESREPSRDVGILVYSPNAMGGLMYYYDGRMKVYEAIPSRGLGFGTYDLDLIRNRLRAISNLREIYFVDHYRHMFDPNGVVASEIEARYSKVEDFWDRYRIHGGRYVKRGSKGHEEESRAIPEAGGR